jgi:hypothetical protein
MTIAADLYVRLHDIACMLRKSQNELDRLYADETLSYLKSVASKVFRPDGSTLDQPDGQSDRPVGV